MTTLPVVVTVPAERFKRVADQRDLLAEFVARVAEEACCLALRDEAGELLRRVEHPRRREVNVRAKPGQQVEWFVAREACGCAYRSVVADSREAASMVAEWLCGGMTVEPVTGATGAEKCARHAVEAEEAKAAVL